ncbi:MAG: hypothetical protein ACRCT1_10800 [Microcoleaceae cyanobacterium]
MLPITSVSTQSLSHYHTSITRARSGSGDAYLTRSRYLPLLIISNSFLCVLVGLCG